jgi:hypothetical protein
MSEKEEIIVNIPIFNWVVVFCVGFTLILTMGKLMGKLPDTDWWIIIFPIIGLLALLPTCFVIAIVLKHEFKK